MTTKSKLPPPLRDHVPERFRDLAEDLWFQLPDKKKRLTRSVPNRTQAVSVTGDRCDLNCAHCDGHYLRSMTPLTRFASAIPDSINSLLISGGSTARGAVPLAEAMPALLALPENLALNLHVGLQDSRALLPLKKRNVTVSFDLIGDTPTIREVFGLDHSPDDYFKAYLDLCKHFRVIPHLVIGLRGGRLSGEERVLEFLHAHVPPALTLLVFRPTPGSRYAEAPFVPIEEVIAFVRQAAQLPCELRLGCMRPAGRYRRELDLLCWLAGTSTIVLPDRGMTHALEQARVPIFTQHECCSLPATKEDSV